MEITNGLHTIPEFCEAVRISIRHYFGGFGRVIVLIAIGLYSVILSAHLYRFLSWR
jgi:hypothetical protein